MYIQVTFKNYFYSTKRLQMQRVSADCWLCTRCTAWVNGASWFLAWTQRLEAPIPPPPKFSISGKIPNTRRVQREDWSTPFKRWWGWLEITELLTLCCSENWWVPESGRSGSGVGVPHSPFPQLGQCLGSSFQTPFLSHFHSSFSCIRKSDALDLAECFCYHLSCPGLMLFFCDCIKMLLLR